MQFNENRTFEGVRYPRFESQPQGPKETSYVLCTCGRYWKDHRFRDGACPLPDPQPLDSKETLT